MEKRLAPAPYLSRPILIAILVLLPLYFLSFLVVSSPAIGANGKSINTTSLTTCVKGKISQHDIEVDVIKVIPRKQLPYIDYTLAVKLNTSCHPQGVEVYTLYSSSAPVSCDREIEGGIRIPYNTTRGGENNSSTNRVLLSFTVLKSLIALIRIQCREGYIDVFVKPESLENTGRASNSSSSTRPQHSPIFYHVNSTSAATPKQYSLERSNGIALEDIVYYSILLATLFILLLGYVQEKRYHGKRSE